MSKILVVGGAGYVGGHLVDILKNSGNDVVVYDALLYEESFLKDVKFIRGSVLDTKLLSEALKDVDVVVWLAAIVGDPACAINENLTIDVNVKALEFLASTFKGRIIFPSTCSVYGAQHGLLDENSELNPLSLYAKTKIDAEKVLLQNSSNVSIFRLGTLFGVSDQWARLRADLVLNVLTIKAILSGEMSVFGGDQYRPLLHVKDVGNAMKLAIDSEITGVFNLHTENITIVELAKRIRLQVPGAELTITEMPFQDQRNYQVSSQKAEDEIGFIPQYTVDDGIREVAKLVKDGRVRNVFGSRYSNFESLRDDASNQKNAWVEHIGTLSLMGPSNG